MLDLLSVLFIWVASAVLTYGGVMAFMATKFPESAMRASESERQESDKYSYIVLVVLLALGPMGAVVAFFTHERFKFGFKFR